MKLNTDSSILKSALASSKEPFTALSTTALLAKNAVPASHKRIADNYVIINRIYKFPAVMSKITNMEKTLLSKYSFNTLENTTIERINEELAVLQNLSTSEDELTRKEADAIMQTRAKELKYIVASRYRSIDNELNNGYIALERYFEEISKH